VGFSFLWEIIFSQVVVMKLTITGICDWESLTYKGTVLRD